MLLIAGGLGTLALAMVVVTVLSLTGGSSGSAAEQQPTVPRGLPVYWTVKRGDTYAEIAAKTGLTVDQLETFNPYVDPSTIVPGQRLKLRLHLPKPKPKPLGPRTYRVRGGDTFFSIAARTHHRVATLRRLNRKVSPEALRPGQRLRLR